MDVLERALADERLGQLAGEGTPQPHRRARVHDQAEAEPALRGRDEDGRPQAGVGDAGGGGVLVQLAPVPGGDAALQRAQRPLHAERVGEHRRGRDEHLGRLTHRLRLGGGAGMEPGQRLGGRGRCGRGRGVASPGSSARPSETGGRTGGPGSRLLRRGDVAGEPQHLAQLAGVRRRPDGRQSVPEAVNRHRRARSDRA